MSVDKQRNNSVAVSEKRRKLLKASAATPLVATLTLGSEQANASAYQCASNNTNPVTSKYSTSTDNFVRVVANQYVHLTGGTPSPIYEIASAPGVYYDDNGPVSIVIGDYTAASPASGYVLVVYEPQDNLGAPNNTQPTQAQDLGPWPKIQIDPATNQPLYNSCFDSIPIVGIINIKGNIV